MVIIVITVIMAIMVFMVIISIAKVKSSIGKLVTNITSRASCDANYSCRHLIYENDGRRGRPKYMILKLQCKLLPVPLAV